MKTKDIFKTISYLEESKEDCIFYPPSLFWGDKITEDDIFNNWRHLIDKIKADPVTSKGVWIYLHYPFCSNKCSYCFLDTVVYEKKYENYLELVKREIKKFSPIFQWVKIRNLYIWWGTISLLGASQIDDLLENMKEYFDFSKIEQITAEVSPLTTTKEKIQCFKKHGLNRLVFWVQSLDKTVLQANNRFQNTEKLIQLIWFSRAIGIENIKIDLIAWLPWDTLENFTHTLKLTKDQLDINELSIYPFVPHKNTDFVLSWWEYTQQDMDLRSKMMILGRKFTKQYQHKYSWSYNHQIIEEEQCGLSILGLWFMSISKIFWRGVYKKESFSDYEDWLLNEKPILFRGINYSIEDEHIAYLTRNLRKFYEKDFEKVFWFPIQESPQFLKIKKLLSLGIMISCEDENGKYFWLKDEGYLNMIIFSKYLYPENMIRWVINSEQYKEYHNIDFLLKQIFEEY